MSKGNSRKGNREIKKPKKDTVKVLATANTMTNPGSIQLGTKKSKWNENHYNIFNRINFTFHKCTSQAIWTKQTS